MLVIRLISEPSTRADERTRTADLLITSKPLPTPYSRVNTPFCRSFFGAAVRAITLNIALYRPYCCHYCCHVCFLNSGVPAIGPHVMWTCRPPRILLAVFLVRLLSSTLLPLLSARRPNVLLTCKCDSDRGGSKFGIAPPPVFRIGKPKKKSRIRSDIEYK